MIHEHLTSEPSILSRFESLNGRTIKSPRAFYSGGKWWVSQPGHKTDGPFDNSQQARDWLKIIYESGVAI